jgi:F0F1-type ATP synthase membrane subunit b/b'
MAASMKRLFKAAVTLAAAALVQKGIQRAGKDQRVRRKVADLQKTVRDQVPVARKKAGKMVDELKDAAGKRVPQFRQEAAKQIKKLAKVAGG